MMDLCGKRLLVLGGINITIEAIRLAQSMGIWVAVTDYNKDTPAKKIADMAFDVSTTDIDSLEKLCHENRIDGVFTNWIEAMLPWGQRLCERMGFPYPFTLEQIETYAEKEKFKNLCKMNGVPVPRQYCLTDYNDDREISQIIFPVIIKPVDNSGSRGISVCCNQDQFKIGIEKALQYSRSRHVMVEEYIEEDEITVNYVIENGDVLLTSIHDRYFNREQNGVLKTPDIYIYPSKYTERYLAEVDPIVTKMIRKSKLQNGSIFMQACVKDGQVYFYEAGMRLNGCKIHQLVNAESNYNALERLIHYALTGSMGTPGIREKINPRFKHWYSTISLLARPGTIGIVTGLEALEKMHEIIGITPWYFPGEEITPEMRGTLQQTVVRISLGAETKEDLLEAIRRVYETVKVYDTHQKNMLLTPHDIEDLRKQLNYELPLAPEDHK